MQLVRRHHELFWHLGNNTSHLLDTDVSVHPPIGGGGKVADKFWQFNWRKTKITMNFLIPQSKDLLQMPILGFDDKECLLFSSSIIHLNTWLVPWLAGRIHNLHSAHVKLSKFKFYWIAEYNVTSSIKSFVEDHHNKKKTFLIEQNGPFLWQVALSSSCVVCPPRCPPHRPAHNIWFFWFTIFLSLQFRICAITKVICTLRPSLSFQVLICNKLSYLGLFYALPINICCENTNINGM